MGGFQWGGTVIRGTQSAVRVFEQTAEQRVDQGGLWWIDADGTKYPISKITYNESDGPVFEIDHDTLNQLTPKVT